MKNRFGAETLGITNKVIEQDLHDIFNTLLDREKAIFQGQTILLTGCAGFLGFYFIHFFCYFADDFGIVSIIGLDNFKLGRPTWLDRLEVGSKGFLKVRGFDISKDRLMDLPGAEDASLVIHMASIASPTFYRQFPLDTIDANIWGLRALLDFYRGKRLKGLLFFSSSEIYGDPLPQFVPTLEEYRGNVSPTGPRACYDESKRFGETLCYVYSEQFGLPIAVVRPFNNYGPGMNLNDRRVPADFAKAVLNNEDISILSDGSPTRTFCYVADAVAGYLKALLYGKFEPFNIGIDRPEITITELAKFYVEAAGILFGYKGKVRYEAPVEKQYLIHNPMRRCPSIKKARQILGFNPTLEVKDGVPRFLEFLQIERAK